MSLQNFLLNAAMQRAQRALMQLTPQHRLKRGRKMMDAVQSRVPAGILVRRDDMAGVAVEWLIPKELVDQPQAPVVVYFHGGVFAMGGFNSHRDMAARLAEKSGVCMLMVDYRLAPEHPFPAALDDASAVYHALLARGVSPVRIAMGGDSAGGNIALATAQTLRDSGAPLPCAMFLFSPWVDLQNRSATHQSNAATDTLLNTQLLDEAVQHYAPGIPRNDVRISPVLGNVAGLPPCLIIASAREVLLDDSIALRDALVRNAVDVELLQWPYTPHAFPVLARWLPEAKDAISKTAGFLRKQLQAQ